jgi:hypothetical protein
LECPEVSGRPVTGWWVSLGDCHMDESNLFSCDDARIGMFGQTWSRLKKAENKKLEIRAKRKPHDWRRRGVGLNGNLGNRHRNGLHATLNEHG